MPLSSRPTPYIIPEYSLTGDLLSYLTCGLQYRYHNKGSLPPSTPVQLWFGEFIHGVMEEAYRDWRNNHRRFPWTWNPEIRDIELQIDRRLRARGLNPPPRLFCPFDTEDTNQGLCHDINHPHQLIASRRAEAAINTWGSHLFPLIDDWEVRLKGIRQMPNYMEGVSRSNYYGVTGIIDVISSVNLQNAPSGNLVLHYLHNNAQTQDIIGSLTTPEYEIIIDYKGMRRPPSNDPGNRTWQHHEWQVLTYAWLRSRQPGARRIVAGLLFYFNELVPLRDDIASLKKEIGKNQTDVVPSGLDIPSIRNWRSGAQLPNLSTTFREQRSIRIIPVNDISILNSLDNFDHVVSNIEESVLREISGNPIRNCWTSTPVERTCDACDFKTFCLNPSREYAPTVP
jgi:hypothetical protein